MILFNFIPLYKIGQHSNKKFSLYHWQLRNKGVNCNSEDFIQYLFFKKRKNMMSPNINLISNKEYLSLLFDERENNNLLYRNFWQKLINKYIKETIFISSANSLSNSYSSKLKSLNLSVYKGNEYKKFLHSFNKDLVRGKINVDLNNLKTFTFTFPGQKRYIYLKYNWLKLLNFQNISFFNYKQKMFNPFIDNLLYFFNSALPLFIVINDNKEIIVSESAQQLSKGGTFFDSFNYFAKKYNSNKKLYTGLLFINPQDALEYKNYIELKYSESTRKTKIQVVPANIHLYHKLMILQNNSIEFRLVPDLKEISSLIYEYKKYNNISFNKNQKYGRSFFQGQPLYIIKPFNVKRHNHKDILRLKSLPISKKDDTDLKYQPVFLHYNTLLSVWNKFKNENPDYQLPYEPKVSIFNLESFIKDESDKKNYNNIIFLPSYKTYDFIKNYFKENFRHQKDMQYWIFNRGLVLKTLLMRVFWSLTSRQPINWY
uniref:Ycf80 n=1 Tax=Herposiphonia versicolor TaxID=2007163 RepID=A0A1Z1MF71_9FLOR|nr:hypothetical protein [Herposiphonia versicolor]ARW64738.1 hypothetical protein [Herposiphonia versicolor]